MTIADPAWARMRQQISDAKSAIEAIIDEARDLNLSAAVEDLRHAWRQLDSAHGEVIFLATVQALNSARKEP